ncbi:hypothetical protein C8F04DRAFT_1329335 [Mycena alexandri]|uniref:Uncharacterized protein n=1 Tax=Mycena alexandri TaxID=1745969 RepID=A0AAD6S016_9AGAR|nr:hypothetical protein C8F04DRAFT_1329335 [Mycena alexandri]
MVNRFTLLVLGFNLNVAQIIRSIQVKFELQPTEQGSSTHIILIQVQSNADSASNCLAMAWVASKYWHSAPSHNFNPTRHRTRTQTIPEPSEARLTFYSRSPCAAFRLSKNFYSKCLLQDLPCEDEDRIQFNWSLTYRSAFRLPSTRSSSSSNSRSLDNSKVLCRAQRKFIQKYVWTWGRVTVWVRDSGETVGRDDSVCRELCGQERVGARPFPRPGYPRCVRHERTRRTRQRHPQVHRASPASEPAAALARVPRVRRTALSARKQARSAHLTTAQLAADPAHPFSSLDVCGDGTHTHTHGHGIHGECDRVGAHSTRVGRGIRGDEKRGWLRGARGERGRVGLTTHRHARTRHSTPGAAVYASSRTGVQGSRARNRLLLLP